MIYLVSMSESEEQRSGVVIIMLSATLNLSSLFIILVGFLILTIQMNTCSGSNFLKGLYYTIYKGIGEFHQSVRRNSEKGK